MLESPCLTCAGRIQNATHNPNRMTQSSDILPQPEFLGLLQRLQSIRAQQPDHIAFWFQGSSISYAQFEMWVRQARQQFLRWGVQPGDRVACLALAHPLQLAALWALSELGAIWVPLNFRLAPAEWAQVLQDCQAGWLLSDEQFHEPARSLSQQLGIPLHLLSQLQEQALSPGSENIAHGASNLDAYALLVYTSGTTGRPKGALHTLANLWANAQAAQAAQRLTPQDRILTVLPIFHVGGLCIQTLPALLAGATVVLHPRFDPDMFWRDLVQHQITLTLMVPAVMKACIDHPAFHQAALPSLREIWAGSSVLPDDLVQPWLQRGIPVCNVYGATETGPFTLALGPEHARSHMGSCGWPAIGVQAKLTQIGSDGVGQVCVRGPAIVQNYWPKLPAVDEQGWFHTGDLARIDTDQSWLIVGRSKDMIISGGENIYPAEVEQVLQRHPAVQECAVIGLPDPKCGERVVAVVVFKPGPTPHESDLLAAMHNALARYKHPRQFVQVQELPKTALGKIQKDLLARQLSGSARIEA